METTENSKIKVKKVTQSELLLSGWKGGEGTEAHDVVYTKFRRPVEMWALRALQPKAL